MTADRVGTKLGRAALLLGLVSCCAVQARADRIILRGGSQIRGVVLPSPPGSDQVLVQTETLTSPIKYRKGQVVQVVPEPSALGDYLTKRDTVSSNAQAQYDLGVWCEEHKLKPFAEIHFRKAIERDPAFAPAHKKLGHVRSGDHWITYDELRSAQGLLKYQGKWITKEEKDKLEAEEDQAVERTSWARRLHVLRQALLFGTPERRTQAEAQLTSIRDPAAASSLVKAFGEDPPDVRTLLARILGSIPGKEASSALVSRILVETDDDVRRATMDELAHREEQEILPQLVRALKAKDLAVINRAAWAIGNLNAVSAVPKLVQALVIVDQQIVWDPPVDSGGGNIGVGFTSIPTGRAANLPGMIGPIATSGASMPGMPYPFYGVNSVTVGPGVVAYGAGFPPIAPVGTGTSLTFTEQPGLSRGFEPKLIRNAYRNTEVLNALQRLTGQNFGYDQAAWRNWLNTSFRPERAPARRVPQP